MKIALVIAPNLFKKFPLIGLAYLSSYMKARKFGVELFDLNVELKIPYENNEFIWGVDKSFIDKFINDNKQEIESIVNKILSTKAEIIGFSIWTTTKNLSLALAKMIKNRDKNRLIVFGGPECSFSAQELIKNDFVDIVALGEGEETLHNIAELFKKDKKVDFCKGTLLKDGKKILDCGFRTEIQDLDLLPFTDYSGFMLEKYYLTGCLPITFYRGCIKRCVFCNCSITWKKYRSRTAENIYSEMKDKIKKYRGLKRFEAVDTAINLNLDMLFKLCDLIIEDNLNIEWGGAAIIHPGMDAKLLNKMAKAGCCDLAYGLESGSQAVLDKMRKAIKISDAERLIRETYQAGIKICLNFIIGFPNETENEFQETMKFIKRNKEFISSISYPSECWIGNNTYLHSHLEEFNVDTGELGTMWRTKDGLNTPEIRRERIKIFNDFVNDIGLSSQNYASVIKEPKK